MNVILPSSLFDLNLENYAQDEHQDMEKIVIRTKGVQFKYDLENNHRPYIQFDGDICAVGKNIVPIGTREEVTLIYQFTNSEISVLGRKGFYDAKYSIPTESLCGLDFTLSRPVRTFNIGQHKLYELPLSKDGSPLIMNGPQDGYGSILGLFPNVVVDDGIIYTNFASSATFLTDSTESLKSEKVVDAAAHQSLFERNIIHESIDKSEVDSLANVISAKLDEAKSFGLEFVALNSENEYEQTAQEEAPVDDIYAKDETEEAGPTIYTDDEDMSFIGQTVSEDDDESLPFGAGDDGADI